MVAVLCLSKAMQDKTNKYTSRMLGGPPAGISSTSVCIREVFWDYVIFTTSILNLDHM